MKKIKETLCYTSVSSSSTDDSKKHDYGQSSPYTLPDGNQILLKEEKTLPTEILFNPGIIGLEYLCNFFF